MAEKKAAPKKKPTPRKKAPPKKGRPTKYSATYIPKLAELMSRTGMIDKDMAAYMGVAESTFHKWKIDHPEFMEAITRGKEEPDDRVEAAMFHKAIGYSHPDNVIMQYRGEPVIVPTTKYYAPDTLACIFWLKNRRPERWRDRQEIGIDIENDPVFVLADAMKERAKASEPPPK